MWDRLFGRSNDDSLDPACAACGRTLLPGEWAQTVVADDGREEIICSLCAQGAPAEPGVPAEPLPEGVAAQGRPQPAKPRPARDESDAFWRALKEKDAEIGRLRSELVAAEAEKQELAAQLSLLRRQLRGEAVTDWQSLAVFGPEPGEQPAEQPVAPQPSTVDQPTEPFEVPVEETPSEPVAEATLPAFLEEERGAEAEAAAMTGEVVLQAETSEAEPQDEGPSEPAAAPEAEDTAAMAVPALHGTGAIPVIEEGPSWLFETPPHQTFGGTAVPVQDAVSEAAAGESEAEMPPPAAAAAPLFAEEATAEVPAVEPTEEPTEEPPAVAGPVDEAEPGPEAAPTPEEIAAEAAELTLLQRGADLLNVSHAPRKVSETSESLGMPLVHLFSDGESMHAVFLWSMAWYEYSVDLATGDVAMLERGYDDRPDLRPNAKVRSDGTVQVAPLPTRRPAAPAPPPAPAAPEPQPGPGDPRVADSSKADIISKSLKGQRTDDEAGWDRATARDFDWGG